MIPLSPVEILRRRFADRRPGLELVDIVEAVVPVTLARVEVLAQERKPIQLLDEFVLRFVRSGISDIDVLAGLLGLTNEQVTSAVADQISADHVTNFGGRLALTPLGLAAATELASVSPILTPLPVAFDRLTWSVEDYPRSTLIKKRDAEEAGMYVLPAKKHARIGIDDVSAERLNEILPQKKSTTAHVEVLRVRKINSQNQHLYVPAHLLVYGNLSDRSLELALAIDGDLKEAHGLELAAQDTAVSLGITIGAPAERPVLEPELESLRVSSQPAGDLSPHPRDEPKTVHREVDSPPTPDEPLVRGVTVFEHADLLAQALQSARKRIMIISPWVRRAIVSTDFRADLERRLRAGVRVHIAHGFGPDDSDSDADAIRQLENLQTRYQDKLSIVRLTNSHAKILIFDETWISTSFNWLSFKGDPRRTFRMEEGTIVKIPGAVDREYERLLEVLARGGADPRAHEADHRIRRKHR